MSFTLTCLSYLAGIYGLLYPRGIHVRLDGAAPFVFHGWGKELKNGLSNSPKIVLGNGRKKKGKKCVLM